MSPDTGKLTRRKEPDTSGQTGVVPLASEYPTGPEAEARGRVQGDGVALAYGRWPGRGSPIVAIHALTTSYMTFRGLGERLAGRRPLCAFDLRGRGDSDKPPGPYGMAVHAADTAAAMEALAIGPAVVVGHSMGAYVAAALACARPDLVAGVVLLDGGHPPVLHPDVSPDDHLEELLGPVIGRLRQTFATVDAYLETWRGLPTFRDPSGGPNWGPWVDAYLRYDLEQVNGVFRPRAFEAGVREDFADMGRAAEADRRLRAIRCPVLVVRAERGLAPDQPPALSDTSLARIAACVPALVEHTVAETTHYTILLAEPGASVVADLVVGFAARCGV